MISHSLRNMFGSLGFAYAFAFCQNEWSLKIFRNVLWKMSFKNDKIYQSFWGVWGVPKQNQQKNQNKLKLINNGSY